MDTIKTNAVAVLVTLLVASGSVAQLPNPEISDSGSGLVLSLSADGNCWNDCWVQSMPLGQGTTIAIMKGALVVDQGFVDAPLNVTGDAPMPPPDGNGTVSVSFTAPGEKDGKPGLFITTINYMYSGYVIRDVQSRTDFFEDSDPPPDEGNDG